MAESAPFFGRRGLSITPSKAPLNHPIQQCLFGCMFDADPKIQTGGKIETHPVRVQLPGDHRESREGGDMGFDPVAKASKSDILLHQLTMQPGDIPFQIYTLEEVSTASLAAFPHRHDFYQIVYVTEGQGAHIIDFEAYPVRPVILYFVAPGQIHFWCVETAIHGWVIMFTPNFLLLDPLNRGGFHEFAFFHSVGQASQLALMPHQVDPIAQLIHGLDEEYQASAFNRIPALSTYLTLLLTKIQRLYALADTQTNTTAQQRLFASFSSSFLSISSPSGGFRVTQNGSA
jgi:hypothetical protein